MKRNDDWSSIIAKCIAIDFICTFDNITCANKIMKQKFGDKITLYIYTIFIVAFQRNLQWMHDNG